jgi:heterotetrameric sarcosine oxidase delta subunit
MLVIICPHCGPRNSDEFTFKGEVVPRPPVNEAGPDAWRSYLYMRSNTSGWVEERWFHGSGCRRFLTVERDNVSNEIRQVRPLGDGPV